MNTSNGKRMSNSSRAKDMLPPVPQHEELIKYICDSWNKVCQEYQKNSPQGSLVVAYQPEIDPNALLKDFVPFDLEAYWGQRLVQNITQNS